jgi:hypothetical protein
MAIRGVISTSGLRHFISFDEPFKMRGHSIGLYIWKFRAAPKIPHFGGPGLSCDFNEKDHFFVLLSYAEFGFPTATR